MRINIVIAWYGLPYLWVASAGLVVMIDSNWQLFAQHRYLICPDLLMTSYLDIPLPQCVQGMLYEPPVCRTRVQDVLALSLLEKFGWAWNRDKHEIDKACDFASGSSDLVIILLCLQLQNSYQRVPYSVPFADFITQYATLEIVDELIRVCLYNARGSG